MAFIFNSRGLLDPGDYEMTFDQLKKSLLVVGPGPAAGQDWDDIWRLNLVNQAEILVSQLWQVGVTEIFIDGSFVEQKAHPSDIDGYFVVDDVRDFATGEFQRKLNILDPHKIWTWDQHSRKAYNGYMKKQLPMWHKYRVELYPHFPQIGNSSGLRDEHGNEMQFPAAFRRCRATGDQKGVIKIIPE